MQSEWEPRSLKDAGVTLIDCDHRTPKETEHGYPYITIPQLKDGRVLAGEARRISQADFVEWTKKLRPREHDVIVVRRCSSGDSAVVPRGLDCAIGQNLVVLRADGKSVAPPYLRWLVRGAEWWEEVRKYLNVGAVFDSLKCRDIPNFELLIPPLDSQSRIADLLNALDDRIDHNRALAANLEAIAHALFKSWFVDFEPVRAKAAGEAPPGLAPDLAALFPERFVDSELGEIPEGWSMRTIADLAEVVGGSTPSTKNDDYWIDGQHHWATPKDLAALSSPVLLGTERKVTDAGLDQISSGLLPPGTVLLSSRAPIGYLAIAAVPVAINQGFIAMKPKVGVSNLYLLYWAENSHEAIVANANGSTFLEISKKNFRPIPSIDPGAGVMTAFDSVVAPVFDRIVCAQREVATLIELRDLLLPRLISGKLRVEDAEAALEAA